MTVVDGPGFHVDVDKVDEAANGIHQSVQDQDNFELRGLCGNTELYGHTPLHDALMDFSVRWSDGLDVLGRSPTPYRGCPTPTARSTRQLPAACRTTPELGPSTMAELGETQDPQTLLPGKPEAIEENARALRARAGRAGDAADGLRTIDTGGAWQGPAAQAFHDKFSYEPSKWFAAADALQAAAGALDDYAETLRWAQSQATEAIALWNQGQAATRQATAAHDAAAAQATAQNQPVPAFTDPGEASRQAARDTLNRAGAQLAEAGDVAAATLRDKMQYAPQESSWLDDVGNFCADVGAHIVNDVASFGNALLNHPGDVVQALGGLGLTVASSAGEGLGAVLDATGIGAIGGVPLQAVSTAGIATGATLTGTAMASIIQHAAGDDHVEPIRTNESSGTSSTPPEPTPPAGTKPGWSSRPANNGKGSVWQKPGSAGDANSVRIMDPGADPRYPNGYVKFTNQYNQPVKLDGKPGSRAETHIPRNPDGSYPVPEGW